MNRYRYSYGKAHVLYAVTTSLPLQDTARHITRTKQSIDGAIETKFYR